MRSKVQIHPLLPNVTRKAIKFCELFYFSRKIIPRDKITMKDISLFIITKNEGDKLEHCINSAKGICSEIIVCDSGSTDNTAEIARKMGAKVIQHDFIGFAHQKNFALEACSGKWALSLDADEVLTKELADEIANIPEDTEYNGFNLHRVNYFLGGRMNFSGLNNEYILRLIRVGSGRYRDVLVHEGLEIEGKIAVLKNEMLHYSYGDLENYFVKFNKYTSLAARDLKAKGKKFSLLGTILRLPFEFMKRYVLKLGFLDGIRGFIWASCSTFYVFVKYIKLWHLSK